MTLVPVDTSNALAVTNLLEQCRTWIATAVEQSNPMEIALVKAQIATAAEATKQLGLSKEIQIDAQEMVRRAEFALGKAIRKGQAEGEVLARGQVRTAGFGGDRVVTTNFAKASPTDFAKPHELVGQSGRNDGIYGLTDGISSDQFEEAIADAKAEGNVSRANVVRKVKKIAGPVTRDQRADLIADLAARGYSSRQMPSKVGVTEETVRQIAREYDIDITADQLVGRTRRIDHTSVVEATVTALENAVSGLSYIDFSEVDPTEAPEWATSLTNSLSELRRFANQIKEIAHV